MHNKNTLDKESYEKLKQILVDKELVENRLIALETFSNKELTDIKHGLNISTKLSEIIPKKIDMHFLKEANSKNKNILEISNESDNTKTDELKKQYLQISLKEFLECNQYDEIYKKKIINILNRNNQIETVENKEIGQINKDIQQNKLDYLHQILREVKIIIFDTYQSEDIIKIDRIITENEFNHTIIIVNEKSNMNLYLSTRKEKKNNNQEKDYDNHNSDQYNIITDFTDILISKDCQINIIEQRNLQSNDIIYGKKIVRIDENSKVNWITIDKDSKLTFIENIAELNGKNSEMEINNILCGKKSNYTIFNTTTHNAPNTTSLIHNKCSLKESKAIIKGLIKINSGSKDSNGYQKSEAILMDKNSQAISIPELEIHDDRVKCSHGSTISRLDEEKIFYLTSRGINKVDAKKLLIEGFYEVILRKITDEKLRDTIRAEVLE